MDDTIELSLAGATTSDLARQARYNSDTFVNAEPLLPSEFVPIPFSLKINDIGIRQTLSVDDTYSSDFNEVSSIAKAAAINDLSSSTDVRAIIGETTVSGVNTIQSLTKLK